MYLKLIQPKMKMRPMDTGMKIRMAPHLGLLTIANLFRNVHRVVIENENIAEIIYDDRPDIVGITVTVDTLPRAVEIAQEFRRRGIPVVAGGIHITTAEHFIPEHCFDALCVGMAEGTWPNIMQDLAKGCLQKVYRCSRQLQAEDIISPAYDLISKQDYLYCNIVHTSRGCPFGCDFCYNSGASHQYLKRAIPDVIHDIMEVHSQHIMFIDDNFIGDPAWTYQFLQAIKPMKLKWNAAVSANISELPSLLDEMKDSGCQSLFIGFESVNQTSLHAVHKKQNQVKQYEKLVKMIHERGMMIHASFVFGLDEDTPELFLQH